MILMFEQQGGCVAKHGVTTFFAMRSRTGYRSLATLRAKNGASRVPIYGPTKSNGGAQNFSKVKTSSLEIANRLFFPGKDTH
jgi:hypothetical protein